MSRFPWWKESERGRVIGYRVHTGWEKVHIIQNVCAGPIAVQHKSLCGGLRQWIRQLNISETLPEWMVREGVRRRVNFWAPGQQADFSGIPESYRRCEKCLDRYSREIERDRERLKK